MYTPQFVALLLGFLLDLLLGDPRCLPHPIRGFGFIINILDKKFNTAQKRFIKGTAISLGLIVCTFVLFFCIQKMLLNYYYLHIAIASIFTFYGIANRSLIHEAIKVEKTLTKNGTQAAQIQLSNIVGRDTSNSSPQKIRMAVLETLSENLSDAVIAPLFYYFLGGFPLMMTYKMVNTLDSMIAYKNEKYKQFGKTAAYIDDIANFIPARLTALLMAIITMSLRAFYFVFKYGHKHSSPNAGYPEAALAGILNCKLGGPNTYSGKIINKPFIGKNPRNLKAIDVYKAAIINAAVTLSMLLAIIIFQYTFKQLYSAGMLIYK